MRSSILARWSAVLLPQTEARRAEGAAALFGLRLWASVCLALYTAFWLELDDPYWAATSAAIVAQTGLGASLRKGRFRAIGTVIGGIAIVILVAVFPQNHPALLVGLALWGAACGWLATILPNFGGYAAALAEQNDWGFLADPLGVAPDVAIKNQIAQDENPGAAQVLDEIDQMIRQGPHSLAAASGERPA